MEKGLVLNIVEVANQVFSQRNIGGGGDRSGGREGIRRKFE
jgi:hypothetical protein